MSFEGLLALVPGVAVLAVVGGLVYSGYILVSCYLASRAHRECPFA